MDDDGATFHKLVDFEKIVIFRGFLDYKGGYALIKGAKIGVGIIKVIELDTSALFMYSWNLMIL